MLTLVTAVIGLITALIKLHNAKKQNADDKVASDDKVTQILTGTKKAMEDLRVDILTSVQDYFACLSDEDKKLIGNNVDTVVNNAKKNLLK